MSPASVDLREHGRAQRRDRIVDAARRIIVRDGIDALAMRGLAAEAGVAVRTLYNLFDGRAAILVEISRRAMDRMDAAFEAEAPLDDPIGRAHAVVVISIRHVIENEAVYRPVLLRRPEGAPRPDTRSLATRAGRMQAVALRAAMDRGLLREDCDPECLGRLIYDGWEHAARLWANRHTDAEGFEARALYALYVALLAVATDAHRDAFVARIRELEARLTRSVAARAAAVADG
jgi:AcrR family transcriptional regulator